MLWTAVLLIVASFLLLWVMYRGLRWAGQRWARKLDMKARTDYCPCGYPLKGLNVARCPECGRVIGFDASPEELGLTDEQLRRVQEVRRAREENP
jgi:hypothetical protein